METKILSLFIACTLLVLSACSTDDLNNKSFENDSRDLIIENIAAAQSGSLAYEKLMQSFSKSFRSNKFGELEYPEYYCGSYIDKKGKLVVYINELETSDTNAQKSIMMLAGSNEIIFKRAIYNYNFLNSIMDKLNEYAIAGNYESIFNNIDIFYLSDKENCIIIELNDYNDTSIDELKKIIDSSAISFRKSSGKIVDNVNMNCGERLSDGTYDASIGYRAKKGNDVGIVTAGHFAALGATIYYGGVNIGTCTASNNSGSVDAAFVKVTNSSYTPTNTLKISSTTTRTLSTIISEPGDGTLINRIGITNGSVSGYIISTNATVTSNGVKFTNLTSVSMPGAEGGSGGVYYSYVSSTGTCYTLGVHKGSNGTISVYSKANLINTVLGTSRY